MPPRRKVLTVAVGSVNLYFEVYILMGMMCDDSIKQSALDPIGIGWAEAKTTEGRVGMALQVNSAQFANLQKLLGIDSGAAEPTTLTYSPCFGRRSTSSSPPTGVIGTELSLSIVF